ncbi:MAG TPA: transcription initiation factor IIE, partial [Clostridia bacterium]
DYMIKIIPDLFGGKLLVENKEVSIPDDISLDYKAKLTEDETGGSFTIKVSWDIAPEISIDIDVAEDII